MVLIRYGPHKILRHMPLIPRVQRLFHCKELAMFQGWDSLHRSDSFNIHKEYRGYMAWKIQRWSTKSTTQNSHGWNQLIFPPKRQLFYFSYINKNKNTPWLYVKNEHLIWHQMLHHHLPLYERSEDIKNDWYICENHLPLYERSEDIKNHWFILWWIYHIQCKANWKVCLSIKENNINMIYEF